MAEGGPVLSPSTARFLPRGSLPARNHSKIQLTTNAGRLDLWNNRKLETLDLRSLETAGHFEIRNETDDGANVPWGHSDLPALTARVGGLRSVSGELVLAVNRFAELDLSSLTRVDSKLFVACNELSSFAPFGALASVGGDVTVVANTPGSGADAAAFVRSIGTVGGSTTTGGYPGLDPDNDEAIGISDNCPVGQWCPGNGIHTLPLDSSVLDSTTDELVLHIQGAGDHDHTVTFTRDHVRRMRGCGALTVYSSESSGHTHRINVDTRVYERWRGRW